MRNAINPLRKSSVIPRAIQNVLWNVPHGVTKNHPGKLNLCLGLPVMIRMNIATECSVTNGAEAVVVGWKTRPIDQDHMGLDTLFVKLVNPPKSIKLQGLPENVVPISRLAESIRITLSNGDKPTINHTQVPVVPNFAMTDFNSQGRTREFNVCDLHNLGTCQSVYTCLSRGSTLDGTAIVQGFDPLKITGGLSGFLRQEFRELELLDEITRLQYEGKLSRKVMGNTRGFLIHTYRRWKGESYVPNCIPAALKWSLKEPFINEDPVDEAKWQIVSPKSKDDAKTDEKSDTKASCKEISRTSRTTVPMNFKTALGSQPLNKLSNEQGSKKRKRTGEAGLPSVVKKNRSLYGIDASITNAGPEGLAWNNETNSCAYDAMLTILKAYYISCTLDKRAELATINEYLSEMCTQFDQVLLGAQGFENARDNIRLKLHTANPILFPLNGNAGTAVDRLCEYLFDEGPNSQWITSCAHCKQTLASDTPARATWQIDKEGWMTSPERHGSYKSATTTAWLKALNCRKSEIICPSCSKKAVRHLQLNSMPSFIMIAAAPIQKIKVNWEHYMSMNNTQYRLCGLVYFANWHFTARIVTDDGNIWFHDGMHTQHVCAAESNIANTPSQTLSKVQNGCECYFAIYAKVQ